MPQHADTALHAPHLLHIFATFCAGGPQMRTAAILNRLGSEFRHTILPMDGDFAARTRIDPSVPHTLLPPPPRQSSLRYPRTMRRLIRGIAPDLVLTYNWGSMDAFVGAATLPGLPVIHTEDGFGRDEAVRLLPRRVWTRRIWLRFAHRVVVPSETLLRIALGSYKLPRSKVTFIANGIDTDRFTPAANPAKRRELGIPPEALVFGFIGRLSPEKNLPLLLESFAAARLPNARLLIVGEGECGPELRRQAAALGILATAPLPPGRYSPGTFVAHFFLVHNWGIVPSLSWNVPAWSISAEFGAYLLFPVLLLLTRVRTAGAVRLLLTVPLAWLLLALLFKPFDFRLGDGIQQLGTLRCVLQFATGMVACEIFLRYSALLTRLVPGLIAFAFTALGATIHYDIPTAVLVPPAWFALVLALAASRGWFGKLTGWSPLVYLGEISYATYMCHYLVYDVFKLLFVKKEGEATLAGLIGAAVAILLLSPVLYHLVERPCQRWMARKLAA